MLWLLVSIVQMASGQAASPPAKVPAKENGGQPANGKSAPSSEAKPAPAPAAKPTAKPAAEAPAAEKPAADPPPADPPPAPADPDDEAAAENAEAAAVAKPVSADPVQIFGWREHISIQGIEGKLIAKMDTGALTSSVHAEEKELFERDGKKWVRFIVTDPTVAKPVRTRIEAPLVRIARIKEPGGESAAREVVRLSFQIGERKLRGEFTLNNRHNMLAPVLIGRNTIKDLGWVDPSRTHLAEQKLFR
jgi:hypothetical protein